jgi:flagellar hook-basal body complex protein FliE
MNIPGGIQSSFLGGLNGGALEQMNPALQAAKTISPAELEQVAPKLNPAATQSPASADSFGHMLGEFVGEVNAKSAAANAAVNGLLSGQQVPLHQAVIAMEEAGVSFQLMVEMRNKLMEAYQELMRMQM